jgi:hypothetical protein
MTLFFVIFFLPDEFFKKFDFCAFSYSIQENGGSVKGHIGGFSAFLQKGIAAFAAIPGSWLYHASNLGL